MRVRRLIPALSVCLAASVSTAVAQPKADPKKDPAPPAPGTGTGGQEVQMTEDAPPKDMEGKDENPDAPKIIGDEPGPVITRPAEPRRTGYPIEEAMRPITLPKNMTEIALGPHAQVSPYRGSDALRARYGINDKVQIGLTYMIAGIYAPPPTEDKIGVHLGKAVGLDGTVQLQSWLGVRLGVPIYIDPLAVGLNVGVPMKWQFLGGKYAIGGMDDLLNIKVKRFAPSFYQEYDNADGAEGTRTGGSGTLQSRGDIRFSAYGVMQYRPKTAFIGRASVTMMDLSTTRTNVGVEKSGLRSTLRFGVQHTLRKYLDLGFSIGFDDLADLGSFAPAGLIAFRI